MNRNYLKIFYLLAGIGGFLFFTWTGRYLLFSYPDKESLDMGFRVMLRSRHIFLLLFSLLEIGIGVYIRPAGGMILQGVQILATLLIISAHASFAYGFFYETAVETIPQTPVIHQAAYLAVAGIFLHLLTVFEKK
ncbi:MAG: hypothetical protein R2747_24115 [Pyrinomonadaceae bacterium]